MNQFRITLDSGATMEVVASFYEHTGSFVRFWRGGFEELPTNNPALEVKLDAVVSIEDFGPVSQFVVADGKGGYYGPFLTEDDANEFGDPMPLRAP